MGIPLISQNELNKLNIARENEQNERTAAAHAAAPKRIYGSSREQASYRAFVEQLALEEKQEQEKKMAPVHALAAENSRLLAEVREVEKQNLLLIPYEGSSDLL